MKFCPQCGSTLDEEPEISEPASDSTENAVSIPANDGQKEKPASAFTGGAFANAFINWLVVFVSMLTLGLAYPAMMCWRMRWEAKHTFINGRKLMFNGTGAQLFGKYLLWMLLSCITFGIYYIWCASIALEKWKTKHTHYEGWEETSENAHESYFDGNAIQLFGVKLLTRFVTVITLSFGMYWAHCYKERWYCKHTVIDGDHLLFDGKAVQYFGKRLLWSFLTVVTFGIYSFWLAVKSKKWTVSHTIIKNETAESEELYEKKEFHEKEELHKKTEDKPDERISVNRFYSFVCFAGFCLFYRFYSRHRHKHRCDFAM